MSESIAKWFRSAGILVVEGLVEKREAGINNFFDNGYDDADILNLVKLFFGKECAETFLERFVEEFAKIDSAFADDKENEISALAGIILNRMCEAEDVDDISSIAIYTKSYAFLGYEPTLKNIYQQMMEAFEKTAAEKRENINFDNKQIGLLPKGVTFTVEEGENFELDNDDANKLSHMIKKINELCTFVNKNYRILEDKNKILYENTEILWWLLAGYSSDGEKAYSELPLQQAALLVGKDLAEIVQSQPGVYSAYNLLDRVLDKNRDEKTRFAEYIDDCADSVIEELISGFENSIETPILFALYKKMENGEGSWHKAFEKKFGKTKAEYSGSEIAYQMYLECLMLKWLS